MALHITIPVHEGCVDANSSVEIAKGSVQDIKSSVEIIKGSVERLRNYG